MKKLLITGFTPFGEDKINPAFEAVKLLPNQIKDIEIIKLEIPTSFTRGPEALKEAISTYEPDYVVCIGQAGGRSGITPEFVAINYAQARIPDNDGISLQHQRLIEDGPDAYFTTLPVYSMVEALRDHGIPASVSYSAGTFVCNALMYHALHIAKRKNMKAGFIHVPFMMEQVIQRPNGTPSMNLRDIEKGLEICIQTICEKEEDIIVNNEGEIC